MLELFAGELLDGGTVGTDELFDAPLVIPELVGVGADVVPTKVPVLPMLEPVLDVLAPALMPLCTLDPLAGDVVVPLKDVVLGGAELLATVTPADAFTVAPVGLDELLAELPLPAGTLPPTTNVPGLPAGTVAGLAFVADVLFAFAVWIPPQLVIIASV